MSSTRQPKREGKAGQDQYPTPTWAVDLLIERLPMYVHTDRPRILEPCAGRGPFVSRLRKHYPLATIDTVEIQSGTEENLRWHGADTVATADFLTLPPPQRDCDLYDLIPTNPPYSLALEFIKRARLWLRPSGAVIMLLRLGTLEGGDPKKPLNFERHRWMRENMPDLLVFSRRPSFVGGNDSAAYAFFAWPKHIRDWGRCFLLRYPTKQEVAEAKGWDRPEQMTLAALAAEAPALPAPSVHDGWAPPSECESTPDAFEPVAAPPEGAGAEEVSHV